MPLPEPLQIPFGYRLKEQYRNGLVGHWKMNVNNGNMLPDLSGYNNHGTLTNMANPPTALSGWAGQGLSFDGVDDCVSLGVTAFDFNTLPGKTFSAWVKGSNVGDATSKVIISSTVVVGNAMSVKIQSNEVRSAWYNGVSSYGASGSIYAIGDNWFYVVYVKSSQALYPILYINGVRQAGATASQVSGVIGTTIGNRPDGLQPFNGIIDDVRIYNRALSADEIAHSYYQQEDEWDLGLDDDWAMINPIPIIAYQNRLRREL